MIKFIKSLFTKKQLKSELIKKEITDGIKLRIKKQKDAFFKERILSLNNFNKTRLFIPLSTPIETIL
jgi:hypothetical protein